MSIPRVTVVVPMYNGAGYIERTLASVFAQTFTDFEIIVIDDGSTDIGPDLVLACAARDKRLRLVQQTNRGLAAARNRGIAEAVAPLVAPIDADDLWHPEFLQCTTDALATSSLAPFAFSYSFHIDVNDVMLPSVEWTSPPRHDFIGLIHLNSVGNGSAAVFRRRLIKEVGGYDESLRQRAAQGAEDWKLVLELARHSSPVLIPRQLVGYRQTPTGMSRANPIAQWAAVDAVLSDLLTDYPTIRKSDLANGRTMIIAWLLPALLRNKRWWVSLRLGARAYLCNPLWICNRSIRHIHSIRLQFLVVALYQAIFRRPSDRLHLSQWQLNSQRPFAFLDQFRTKARNHLSAATARTKVKK